MSEIPAQIEDKKTPGSKDSIITKAKKRVQSLLSEIGERMEKKPEQKVTSQKGTSKTTDKVEKTGKIIPEKEDGDDGYDENNLPAYIQAIDKGENPE